MCSLSGRSYLLVSLSLLSYCMVHSCSTCWHIVSYCWQVGVLVTLHFSKGIMAIWGMRSVKNGACPVNPLVLGWPLPLSVTLALTAKGKCGCLRCTSVLLGGLMNSAWGCWTLGLTCTRKYSLSTETFWCSGSKGLHLTFKFHSSLYLKQKQTKKETSLLVVTEFVGTIILWDC